MNPDVIRKEIIFLLQKGNAHECWKDKLESFPIELINQPIPGNSTPNGLPFTAYELLEHVRICQADIIEFIRNPEYKEKQFPLDFWNRSEKTATKADWDRALNAFASDVQELVSIVADPARDLSAELPHAPGYTLFREVLVVADHNSYHLGQIGVIG
jgi:hypothetical protein